MMSGLEIVGVVLGAFPLIITALEHWREVARVGGFYIQIRKEYNKCLRGVQFHQIQYKQNLRMLLLPIVNDPNEIDRLIRDPGGRDWSSSTLQKDLEGRLHDSLPMYMGIIDDMGAVLEELTEELSLDKSTIQTKLAPPDSKKDTKPSSPQPLRKPSKFSPLKSKLDYQKFRLKFSLNEPVRKELFTQLKNCNERLEKLLDTSDKLSSLKNAAPTKIKQNYTLETAFKKIRYKSEVLFKALQDAWQCSCQEYHFANLRLEHPKLLEICFEVILTSVDPSPHGCNQWFWKELRCTQKSDCTSPHKLEKPSFATKASTDPSNCTMASKQSVTSRRQKSVAIAAMPVRTARKVEFATLLEPNIRLCQLLGSQAFNNGKCIGIISYGHQTYHLLPSTEREKCANIAPVTLDHILSYDFKGHHLSRRHRYNIALLLASSVAQLHCTPWLRNGLTKRDVLFFPRNFDGCSVLYDEPFIQQGFSIQCPTTSSAEGNDGIFYTLGILLLELCFGQRLEDHPLRKRREIGAGDIQEALDLITAIKWSQDIADEGGDDFATAVKWCFTGAKNTNQSLQGDIIKNVVRPLETCQDHFNMAVVG